MDTVCPVRICARTAQIADVMRARPFITRPFYKGAQERLPPMIVAVVALMDAALLLLHAFPRLSLGSLALRL